MPRNRKQKEVVQLWKQVSLEKFISSYIVRRLQNQFLSYEMTDDPFSKVYADQTMQMTDTYMGKADHNKIMWV